MSKTINQILRDLIEFYESEEKKEMDKEKPQWDRVRLYSWTAYVLQEGLDWHWTVEEANEEMDKLVLAFRTANTAKKSVQGQLDERDFFYRSIITDLDTIQGMIHGVSLFINIISKENKWEDD